MTVLQLPGGLKIHTSGVLTLDMESGVITFPVILLTTVGVLTLDMESGVITFPRILLAKCLEIHWQLSRS